MYTIYCFTNKTNDKKYVGITKRTLRERMIGHYSEAFNPNSDKYNTPFKQAIRKYGKDGFTIEVLEEVDDIEQANEKEKYYIQHFNTYYYAPDTMGYNTTLGGDGISIVGYTVVQICPKTADIIKVWADISTAQKELEIYHIRDAIDNLIMSSGGYLWFREDILKLSDSDRYDLVALKTKKIVQLEKGSLELIKVWDGATEAAQALGTNDSNIIKAYMGRSNSAKGFVWRTYYDYINEITPTNYIKPTIKKFDENQNFVGEFNTLREASEGLGITEQTLGRHVNKDKLYKGYYWIKN